VCKIEVLNGPFRFCAIGLPFQTRSEKGELITIDVLVSVLGLEVPGIVPPFRSKIRVRKMILWKREGFSRQGPFEILGRKVGGKNEKGEDEKKETNSFLSDRDRR